MIRRSKDGKTFAVISAHAHLGESSMFERYNHQGRRFLGPEMISNIDHFGVDVTVAFPMADPRSDYADANWTVLDAAKAHPDRIIPFARLNPHYEETAAASVSTYAQAGFKGLKLHPFIDAFAANDPVLVRPIMEEANRFALPVLFHTGEAWTTLPALVWDLAVDYPNVKFILGHAGQFGFDAEAMALAKRTDNMWLETSELWTPQRVRTMVNRVGKERVIFGTDAPYINSAAEIEKILRFSDLRDDELEAIFSANIESILGLPANSNEVGPTVDYPIDEPIFWF